MEETGCFSEIVEEHLKSIDQDFDLIIMDIRRSNRIMEE